MIFARTFVTIMLVFFLTQQALAQGGAFRVDDTNIHNNTRLLRPVPLAELGRGYFTQGNAINSYSLPYASAAVRYATYRTNYRFADAPTGSMGIIDVSRASGDTPWQWTGPRGSVLAKEWEMGEEGWRRGGLEQQGRISRHPGNTHDGGRNFDLGYYRTSNRYGLAVCPNNGSHCTGPADALDSVRQAYWFMSLFELQNLTGYQLIGPQTGICVDAQVKRELDRAFELAPELRQEFSRDLIARVRNSLTSAAGCRVHHHHHTHIPFAIHRGQDAARAKAAIDARIRAFTSKHETRDRRYIRSDRREDTIDRYSRSFLQSVPALPVAE